MERPELTADPKFATRASRAQRMEEMDELVGSWSRERKREALFDALSRAGVPAAPVRDIPDVIAEAGDGPDAMLLAVESEDERPAYQFGNPLSLSDSEPVPPASAPELGAHTGAVLAGLGLTSDQIAELAQAGVI